MGPFMPAWCLICAALLACLSPAQPTKSLDLSLTLTNNVIHVNDVPEHLLTMYPVCTQERIPTAAGVTPADLSSAGSAYDNFKGGDAPSDPRPSILISLHHTIIKRSRPAAEGGSRLYKTEMPIRKREF